MCGRIGAKAHQPFPAEEVVLQAPVFTARGGDPGTGRHRRSSCRVVREVWRFDLGLERTKKIPKYLKSLGILDSVPLGIWWPVNKA